MKDRLRHATLRQLQIFSVAAENQSFVRAAEILHLTQPTVSMQMSRLAESVGLNLFKKHGRRLYLTQAGETLFPHVQRVIQTLREASEEMDSLESLKYGSINIAMVTTARYFAPKLISQFHDKNPEIEIDLSIANRENVIEMLENNQIDLAIMGRPPARIPVVAEAFAEHPYVIISAPDHPYVEEKRLSAKKLMGEVFLAREPGSGTRMLMDHYFTENELDPPSLQNMTSNESIKQSVMAGMGLALISRHTIGLEYQTGHLAILNVQSLPIKRTWYVIHLADIHTSPAANAFKEFMKLEAPTYMKNIL